jgi:hypothetical protein
MKWIARAAIVIGLVWLCVPFGSITDATAFLDQAPIAASKHAKVVGAAPNDRAAEESGFNYFVILRMRPAKRNPREEGAQGLPDVHSPAQCPAAQ